MAYTLEQTARRINLLVANEKQLAEQLKALKDERAALEASLGLETGSYNAGDFIVDVKPQVRFDAATATTYCTSGFASRSRPLHSPRSISPEKNLLRLRKSSAHGSPSRLQTKGVNT